jgi:hypothetical protein
LNNSFVELLFMVYRAYIRSISRDDVRRIMEAVARDARYRGYRDWLPRDGLIGPSGLAVLEALAAGKAIPDRVDTLMSAEELNRRWQAVLQNDQVRRLFLGTPGVQFTLPPVLPPVPPPVTEADSPAQRLRRLLNLPPGTGMPAEAEILSGIDRLHRDMSRLARSFSDGPLSLASLTGELEIRLAAFRDALGAAQPTMLQGDLLRILHQNPDDFVCLVEESDRMVREGREGLLARYTRELLGLPGGATMPPATAVQARMDELIRAVEAADRTVKAGSGTIDLDEGPSGETPRAVLLQQLRELRQSLGASGANVAQILEDRRDLMRDVAAALGGTLPPQPAPPSPTLPPGP